MGYKNSKNVKNSHMNIWGILAGLMIMVVLANSASAYANPTAPNLGTAGGFVILSKAGITNVPTSTITGHIGTSPITGASITGLGCTEITGTIYTVDDTGPACRAVNPTKLTTAVSDMEAAYTQASSLTPDNTTINDISGLTLERGIYTSSSFSIASSGNVTLNGSASDVFIFITPGGITLASGSYINLIGGALASNVYWVSATTTALGTTANLNGTVLSMTDITMATGATLNGRALAQSSVTLDSNTVTAPAGSTPANNPPVLGSIGNRVVTEGRQLVFGILATDADSDLITYTTNADKGVLGALDGGFVWTPTHADVGVHTWTFNASDGIATDSETITITVQAGGGGAVSDSNAYNGIMGTGSEGSTVGVTDGLPTGFDYTPYVIAGLLALIAGILYFGRKKGKGKK